MLFPKKHDKIIKIAVGLFIMTLAIFLLADFAMAATNFWWDGDSGANFANDSGLPGGNLNAYELITKIIRWVIGFLGIIAVILIIYGGFLWMTSGGNPQKIELAKSVLKNALIGLIIIILSFAIVSFILNLLANSLGGTGNNQSGQGPGNTGLGALGAGIVQSHYPARGQKEVPRNTGIIVTFREAMMLDTLCTNVDNTDPNHPICNGGQASPKESKIINNNVRIFKLVEEKECLAESIGSCPSLPARVYSTADKKTFVFVPDTYLGSPSEYIDYAVYLTPEIKKANGDLAFAGSFGQGYEWSFEVSNKIDLIPPQVESGGVFPAPDVSQDSINTISVAEQAKGTIVVSQQPSSQINASAADPVVIGVSQLASATINNNCLQQGTIRIAITYNNGLVASLSNITTDTPLGQGAFGQNGTGYKNITFSECNLVLTLKGKTAADIFELGDGWDIAVTKAAPADTLTVGNTVYTFIPNSGTPNNQQIELGTTESDTANNINIKIALNNNSQVTAVWDSDVTVNVTAKAFGTVGNNINLTTSNTAALAITSMKGGTDKEDKVIVIGRRDKPMNATIQIDFNEAIMPLTVSGTADEVKDFIRVVNADPAAKPTAANPIDISCTEDADCKSFDCANGVCTGTNNYLKGKFEISNQYTTVGFVTDIECGFNSCGEPIYCLPAKSHLRVEMQAASLATCGSNTDCASRAPFTVCDPTSEVCQKAAGITGEKYPLAKMPFSDTVIINGVVDAAINSLDGNRNDLAQGPGSPLSYYNENDLYGLCANGNNKQCSQADKVAVCGAGINCTGAKTLAGAQANGDNFLWSFFISDQMDITSPKIINNTIPPVNGTNANLLDRVVMHFDKFMMSSRLTTGSVTITNGLNKITHQLINLKSYATEPLAYWVTNQGTETGTFDGEYDESDVFLNHSSFRLSAQYRAQAGSGLKDIYQNCYLPCKGPAGTCTNCDSLKPSCCNGVPTPGVSCQ